MTTLVCVVDMFTYEGYTREDKGNLAPLYLPYLALGEFVHLLCCAVMGSVDGG